MSATGATGGRSTPDVESPASSADVESPASSAESPARNAQRRPQIEQPLVDLHCHILPALDDGALDLRDSIAMARQGWKDGIAVVCATPHIRDDHDVRIDELPARLSRLSAELALEELPIHVVGGAEIAQHAAARLDRATLSRLVLGGGRSLLIEPAPGPLGDELEALTTRLMEEGFDVIVAHPERHVGPDFEQRLRKLAAQGCLIQWTADFVAKADRGALVFAAKGLLHLLGSDAHSSHGGRPLKLSAGARRLREVCPDGDVEWMTKEAPWRVLRGEEVTVPW